VRSSTWEEFNLPCTLKLSPLVKLLLTSVEFSSEKLDRIQLGLHEALVNAVLHGNASDHNKAIRVRRITTPNWLVWQIQDQGTGIPMIERKASLPFELDAENGRGLFLIHECFDDVRWSTKGNRIQLASRRA